MGILLKTLSTEINLNWLPFSKMADIASCFYRTSQFKWKLIMVNYD